MMTCKHFWILGLVMVACGGRSPLGDDRGDASAVARVDTGLPACSSGLTQCGQRKVSLCYDLSRSQDHCGACGHACPPGIACQAGTCQQVRCQGPLSFKDLDMVQTGTAQLTDAYRPVLGDFDGDGILDLAGAPDITDPGGYLKGAKLLTGTRLFLGVGDGTFTTGVGIETSRINNWRYFSADLNGDGLSDLVSINKEQSAVSVRLGSKNRSAPLGQAASYPTGAPPDGLLLADFDSDGRPDLVAGVASNLEHWRGLGDGRFEHRATLASRGAAPILQAADWNGDGFLDLVYGSPKLRLRYGRGDGTFDPEKVCGLALFNAGSASPYDPVIAPIHIAADLDHDNLIDVLGPTNIFLGLDSCTPSRMVPMADRMEPYNSPLGNPELADLDGDGNLDILNWSEVYQGDGRGAFFQLPLILPGGGVTLVGDLNRDGKLDVISAHTGGWQVSLNTCE